MPTTMDTYHYYESWLQSEEWQAGYLPLRHPLRLVLEGRVLTDQSTAVYIAVDGLGIVDYVGSVRRDSLAGLQGRLRGHVPTARFTKWRGLYVVPLQSGTPEPTVRRIEGDIGRLLDPMNNLRLPAHRFNA